MTRSIGSVALFCALTVAAMAQVTMQSILQETIELSSLTKRPKPYFTSAQASSYDRASTTPGNAEWFANGDAGQFIRVEEREGRKERVMADLTGPGAVVRIWSANPGGSLRFYFDGEDTPRWTVNAKELLGGKVAPFGYPFAYEASMGWDFYAPLPYSKSLKITVDDSENDASRSMYYHVGYRTYEPGTTVETFSPGSVDADLMARYGRSIQQPYTPLYRYTLTRKTLGPEKELGIGVPKGPLAITYFVVRVQNIPERPKRGVPPSLIVDWNDPRQMHNILRQVVLEMDFDGEPCVRTPLGDFFGAAAGPNPYKGFPMAVNEDGTMVCRFVMPYAKNASIRLRNTGLANVGVEYFIETQAYNWTADSYHFKAQFNGDRGRTRPMRDMSFLNTTGEGIFVGDNMHVSNPTPAWWGEGDEKIFVDGETFPSYFGTGTEDYYGYAWCAPIPFSRPFHAEPRADKPGNFGQCTVNRWHIMDPIPFQKSFRFDMEMWHWADVEASYVRTSYWYAKPGTPGPVKLDGKLLNIAEMKPPAPIKDAIEGEGLEIASKTGGETEEQGGFWETSGGVQLWWRDAKPGDQLKLNVPVKKAGRYRVIGHFCYARDYGIQKINIAGAPTQEIDFYSPNLEWKLVDLGMVDLPAGATSLTVEVAGSNDKSNPKRYMFGLDYLKLEPARE